MARAARGEPEEHLDERLARVGGGEPDLVHAALEEQRRRGRGRARAGPPRARRCARVERPRGDLAGAAGQPADLGVEQRRARPDRRAARGRGARAGARVERVGDRRERDDERGEARGRLLLLAERRAARLEPGHLPLQRGEALDQRGRARRRERRLARRGRGQRREPRDERVRPPDGLEEPGLALGVLAAGAHGGERRRAGGAGAGARSSRTPSPCRNSRAEARRSRGPRSCTRAIGRSRSASQHHAERRARPRARGSRRLAAAARPPRRRARPAPSASAPSSSSAAAARSRSTSRSALPPRVGHERARLAPRRVDDARRRRASRRRCRARARASSPRSRSRVSRSMLALCTAESPLSNRGDLLRAGEASGGFTPGWGCAARRGMLAAMTTPLARAARRRARAHEPLSALLLGLQRLRTLTGEADRERALALIDRMEGAVRGMAALLESLRAPPGSPGGDPDRPVIFACLRPPRRYTGGAWPAARSRAPTKRSSRPRATSSRGWGSSARASRTSPGGPGSRRAPSTCTSHEGRRVPGDRAAVPRRARGPRVAAPRGGGPARPRRAGRRGAAAMLEGESPRIPSCSSCSGATVRSSRRLDGASRKLYRDLLDDFRRRMHAFVSRAHPRAPAHRRAADGRRPRGDRQSGGGRLRGLRPPHGGPEGAAGTRVVGPLPPGGAVRGDPRAPAPPARRKTSTR